ncbi:MAG: hypothetical protein ABSA65_15850 [Acidimicrobiales bacterium]|jgi:hypothetical protein
MDVTFGNKALAALCNSEERLVQRWGPDIGETVARRLFDLAASTAASIDRIPEAEVVVNGTGETTITLSERIVIRGVINSAQARTRRSRADADYMVITSVDVPGSERR